MNNTETVAARIREDRMPWSTIYYPKERENAAVVVESGDTHAINSLFATEIGVHEQCGNYIKATELRKVRNQATGSES
jgi:hypothetical protein